MRAPPPTLARVLGQWTLDPGLLAVCVAAAALYAIGVARSRKRWSRLRSASFMAGLLVLVTALMSGIETYSLQLLSVHVAQHMLLYLLAPALLLWGAPVRLALSSRARVTRRRVGAVLRKRWVKILTRPAFGFCLLSLVVLGFHLTGLYEAALRHRALLSLEHAAFFWSGVVFLAPLLAADPIPRPPGALARFAWLMAAMVVMSIPAGLFLFEAHVRYPFYLAPAQALHRSALADQQAAGMIMLVGGGIAMGLLASVVTMQAMIAEERRQLRRDAHMFAELRQTVPPGTDAGGEMAGA